MTVEAISFTKLPKYLPTYLPLRERYQRHTTRFTLPHPDHIFDTPSSVQPHKTNIPRRKSNAARRSFDLMEATEGTSHHSYHSPCRRINLRQKQ